MSRPINNLGPNTSTYGAITESGRKFEKPMDAGKTDLFIDDRVFRKDDDLEENYRIVEGERKQSATRKVCLSIVKALVILLLFAVFVGIVVLIVELVELFHTSQVADLNIHFKLSAECEASSMDINDRVTALDKNQQINFNVTHQPHVTLYLTRFLSEFTDTIISSINQTLLAETQLYNLTECTVSTNSFVNVTGSYALWNMPIPPCLQRMSDVIVNATSQYVDPRVKNTIPSWVNNLPNALKEVKIKMIHFFGSPNVYSQFQPHVTVAHDDINPKQLEQAFASIGNVQPCTFKIKTIAIGQTGDYGTVLRGKDVASFDLSQYVTTN